MKRGARRAREVAVCARAVAYYEYGGEVAPLPEGMSRADWRLVAAMLDMLARTELDRQFDRVAPLPLRSLSPAGADEG
jgi:hypothetical protein